MRVLGNHHSLPWIFLFKICSLRSQIFCFLYVSFLPCFRSLRSRLFASLTKSAPFGRRFSFFCMHLLSLFSLTSFAIRSIRSQYVCGHDDHGKKAGFSEISFYGRVIHGLFLSRTARGVGDLYVYCDRRFQQREKRDVGLICQRRTCAAAFHMSGVW